MGNPDAAAWNLAPIGLAVVTDGKVTRINVAGASMLDLPLTQILGMESPFETAEAASLETGTERLVTFVAGSDSFRDIAYRARPCQRGFTVAFRDVTLDNQKERWAAAVANTAARVASEHSLVATLHAMATEVLRANGLAGVQILARADPSGPLQVMGSAGFDTPRNFFSLLMECQKRGADLRMLKALEGREPVVEHHRYQAVMSDPAWRPLHDSLRHPVWDAFASVPIFVRDKPVGILNVFFAPGQGIDQGTIRFLSTMAEQAALAIDYAELLERERYVVRRSERQRLARDLHDSVVQKVFSLNMQTQVLKVLADRGKELSPKSVKAVTDEMEDITQSVLADLRGLISELQPSPLAKKGLGPALENLIDSTQRRTGIEFQTVLRDLPDNLDEGLAEDVYYITAEAIHNAVKHSRASLIKTHVGLTRTSDELEVVVHDNGTGLSETNMQHSTGHGLASMRERATIWGGTLAFERDATVPGTIVHARVPMPSSNFDEVK
ncbi:histidine kinase [Pseudarthrobacter sp. NPDC058329]|uniref:sensor histidine kinase n=1 Tax=Pseudarthrobacter sp. NPDC058329 TaxID=3346448 RepID=UPI0036D81A3A